MHDGQGLDTTDPLARHIEYIREALRSGACPYAFDLEVHSGGHVSRLENVADIVNSLCQSTDTTAIAPATVAR